MTGEHGVCMCVFFCSCISLGKPVFFLFLQAPKTAGASPHLKPESSAQGFFSTQSSAPPVTAVRNFLLLCLSRQKISLALVCALASLAGAKARLRTVEIHMICLFSKCPSSSQGDELPVLNPPHLPGRSRIVQKGPYPPKYPPCWCCTQTLQEAMVCVDYHYYNRLFIDPKPRLSSMGRKRCCNAFTIVYFPPRGPNEYFWPLFLFLCATPYT